MSVNKKVDLLGELRYIYFLSLMCKNWNPILPNKSGERLTVEELIPLIKRSVRVQLTMQKIHYIKGLPIPKLQSSVTSYLQDLGHRRNMPKMRGFGAALCDIMKNNYKGIVVNEDSIERVKARIGTNPVIFAPTHRSYADLVLMSFLCFYYDIEMPVIAVGHDFQSLWEMGSVLRECGTFFIRRTYTADILYKAIVAEYVSLLIQFSHSALEFFIEGSRSRSGKPLLPKFDLMTLALESYFHGKVSDITIVPVNISYERILEDSLFTSDVLGVPNLKVSLRLLLRALKLQRENYGRVYVEFGEPISVQKMSSADIQNIDPRFDLHRASRFYKKQRYPGPRVSQCVKNLSYLVIREQNRIMTFLPVHIVAVSVSLWFGFEGKVPLELVEIDVRYLKDILVILGYSAEVKETIEQEILKALEMCSRVMYLKERDGIVKLRFGMTLSRTASALLRSSKLTEQTLAEAFPLVILQMYANPVCLACIHICILNFVMCTARKVTEYTKDSLFQDFSFYRSLLQVEFVLYMEDTDLITNDFMKAIDHMCALNLFFTTTVNKEAIDLTKIETLRNMDKEALLLGILYPFLMGYALILKSIIVMTSQVPDHDEKELKWILQKKLEDELSIGRFVPKYILSLDLIVNALTAYTMMGALQKWQNGDNVMIHPIISECKSIQHDLELRVVRLQYLVEASYRRFSSDSYRKKKLMECRL